MNASSLDNVLSHPDLPVLPPAAVTLLDALGDPTIDPARIAAVVSKDSRLANKIMMAVNSGHFKLGERCVSIERAVSHLGLTTVRTLVLGFSLVDLTKRLGSGFNLLDFWRRCFYSAAAARRIAVLTRSCDAEEAFIAALMQDVGMMALHRALGSQYVDIVLQAGGNHRMLPQLEREALGFTHAEAGAELGRKWGVPGQLVEPIRHHHRKVTDPTVYGPTVNTVVLACQIATLATVPDTQASLITVTTMAQKLFGMSQEQTLDLIEAAARDTRGLSGLLEMKEDERVEPGAVVAKADEALIRQQSEVQAQAGTLLLRDEPPADADALCERYHRELARAFELAQGRGTCLGLIAGEIDDYAEIEATRKDLHAVVAGILRRLRERVEPHGVVCELGGGRFAVLLNGATRIDTARLAEQARLDISEHARPLTATLGVAALEPSVERYLTRWELLTQLANNALYTARRAGCNCVRVFSPKRGAA